MHLIVIEQKERAGPKQRKVKWLLVAMLICTWGAMGISSAMASHIAGSDAYLTRISPGKYNLTVRLYNDALFGQPNAIRPNLTGALFSNALINNGNSIPLLLIDLLKEVNQPYVPNPNPYCTNGIQLLNVLTYNAAITIPAYLVPQTTTGYFISIGTCCRNAAMTNILNPAQASELIKIDITNFFDGNVSADITSTPRFSIPANGVACVGRAFDFNSSAEDLTDDVGTKLVYIFTPPLQSGGTGGPGNNNPITAGPYPSVLFTSGATTHNPLGNAGTCTLDSNTGRVSFISNQPGLFCFGVKCTKYLNGKAINAIYRDYQLLVKDCAVPDIAILKLSSTTATITTEFPIQKFTFPAQGDSRCITVKLTGLPSSKKASISLQLGSGAPPLTDAGTNLQFTTPQNREDTATAQLCFPLCTDSTITFNYVLIVTYDNCPKASEVSVLFKVTLKQLPIIPDLALAISAVPDRLKLAFETPAYVTVTATAKHQNTGLAADVPINVSLPNLDPLQVQLVATKTSVGSSVQTYRITQPCLDTYIPSSSDTSGYNLNLAISAKPAQLCGNVSGNVATTPFNIVPTLIVGLRSANPNATSVITPNGDGYNDAWQPTQIWALGCYPINLPVSGNIVNRWGQQVAAFEKIDYNFTADGLPAGVYFYTLKVVNRNLKGSITVLR